MGTGTGRLLELCAPVAEHCIGIDASPAMLALARNRLSRPELGHCRVRQADAYRLPFPAATFDAVLAQMLLHHAEDPAAMLTEAARVLRPGGLLIVVDLEAGAPLDAHGFRWPGFANAQMRALLQQAGLSPRPGAAIGGPATVRLWPARMPAAAAFPALAASTTPHFMELVQ
jgi:ArsR family transcriptional regulator